MSFQAVTWAIEVRVGDPTLKSLLIAICHHADREKWVCWPSQDTLAYETEVSKRTIQRRLDDLEQKGFIKIEKRRRSDGTQDNSLITITGPGITIAPPTPMDSGVAQLALPVDKNGPTGGQKQGSPVDTMSPPIIKQSEQEEQSIVRKSKKGTRIPENWALTPDMGNYGRSKGLHRREVEAEAEKFKNYWTAKPGAAGVKLDWVATWRNWIISAAQRLGRVPPGEPSPDAPMAPGEFDRKTWENLGRLYSSTSNWHRQWGPEPGERGCAMPADLQQQFVTGH